MAVAPNELLPVSFKTGDGKRGRHESLGLVHRPEAYRIIHNVVFIIHPACVKYVLEIGQVLVHIPEAPFSVREQRQFPFPVRFVFDFQLPYFDRLVDRHEHPVICLYSFVLAFEPRVPEPVAAYGPEAVKRLAYRLPGCGPVIAVFIVPDIDVAAGTVHRNAVEPESQHP